MSTTSEIVERLREHAANSPVISRQSIDMDAAAALIASQAEEIERLKQEAGEVWDEAYNEGACDTAGWEKETSHAVLQWLDKEGDGFDIHHPDGNTTDAIIQGLYDAKRVGNLAELRAAALRLDELERENAALRKERDYAVKWGNASVESVQEAMWRYQDALRAVFARLDHPGNADQRVQYFLRWPEIKEARAALAGSGEK